MLSFHLNLLHQMMMMSPSDLSSLTFYGSTIIIFVPCMQLVPVPGDTQVSVLINFCAVVLTRIHEEGLEIGNQVTNTEGLIVSQEADLRRKQADHAEKSERCKRIQFIVLRRSNGKIFKGCDLQNCVKDELRDLFELETPEKVLGQG